MDLMISMYRARIGLFYSRAVRKKGKKQKPNFKIKPILSQMPMIVCVFYIHFPSVPLCSFYSSISLYFNVEILRLTPDHCTSPLLVSVNDTSSICTTCISSCSTHDSSLLFNPDGLTSLIHLNVQSIKPKIDVLDRIG